MVKYKDQDYLRSQQYQDGANLRARLNLHDQFSTNIYNWFLWVFDIFNLPSFCLILELGCGPGDLWLENIHRIPKGWDITLSDFSEGMLRQAQKNLLNQFHPFKFVMFNAQAIPHPERSFDAVIANHMLYHVPDRTKALAEIRRVLRPGGRLYAATVSETHMQELPSLVTRFDPDLAANHGPDKNEFTLENGLTQLSRWFSDVKIHRQENALSVTEVDPLVDYVLSSFWLGVDVNRRPEFKKFIEREIADNNGVIRIKKDSGIFEASLMESAC